MQFEICFPGEKDVPKRETRHVTMPLNNERKVRDVPFHFILYTTSLVGVRRIPLLSVCNPYITLISWFKKILQRENTKYIS